jgi:hypothetical protein
VAPDYAVRLGRQRSGATGATGGVASHRPATVKTRGQLHPFRLITIRQAHNSMFERAWRKNVTRSALIVVAAALVLGCTSLASAKSRGSTQSKPSHPATNETAPRPTVPDPYYRLSNLYYGDSDPYRGLFDFFVVPPYGPGNAYRYLRPVGR